jgi:hypothetical protein
VTTVMTRPSRMANKAWSLIKRGEFAV